MMNSEHLEYLKAVTDALNALGEEPHGMYLRVQLVQDDGRVLGQWHDEHGPDDWWFDTDVRQETSES